MVAYLEKKISQGTWVAQSGKCPTLDFGSGHDLMVGETEPHVGLCADSVWNLLGFLSLPLSLPLPCSCTPALSLSLSKKTNKIKKKKELSGKGDSEYCFS